MTQAVRDGKLVVPCCPECGCRLHTNGVLYAHYGITEFGRDARGCECEYIYATFYLLDKKVVVDRIHA